LFDLSQLCLEWLNTGQADLNLDSIVNFEDFAVLAQNWRISTVRCSLNIPGDLNNDCVVDLLDLDEMSFEWLGIGQADLNGDSIVNFFDFAILAQNWFVGK
jgi:hypothetical protein